MDVNKATRGKGFSEEEKLFLLQLVDAQKNILLCKKTDQVSNKQKAGAWGKITEKFNKKFMNKQRTTKHLKTLYDNMKRKTRQGVAESNRNVYLQKLQNIANEDKREMNRTGGGAYKPQLTNEQERVLAMLGETVKPLANPYDSAADYFNDKTSTSSTGNLEIEPSLTQDSTSNSILPQIIHAENENSEYWKSKYYKQKTLNGELQHKILELELRLIKKRWKNAASIKSKFIEKKLKLSITVFDILVISFPLGWWQKRKF